MRKCTSLPILSEALNKLDVESASCVKKNTKFWKVVKILIIILKHSARIGAVLTAVDAIFRWI